MRIAKPMLLVTTPIGVVLGLIEAWRFHWWLALLMLVLVSIVGALVWLTVRRVRIELAETNNSTVSNSGRSHG
jgi:hypothetical protein